MFQTLASMPSPSEAAARRAGIGAAATSAKTKSVAKSKVADKTKCTAKATSKPSINVLVKKSTTRTMPKNCVVDAAVEKAEEAELAVKTAVVAEKGEAASSKRRVLSTINYKEVEDDDDDSMLDENRTMMKKKAVTSKKKKPKTTENAAASMTTTNTTTTTMTTMVTNDITYSKRLAAEVKPDGKTWPGMKAEYWPHPNHPSYNWANPTYGRFFNDNGVEDENGLWQWRNSHEAWYRQ